MKVRWCVVCVVLVGCGGSAFSTMQMTAEDAGGDVSVAEDAADSVSSDAGSQTSGHPSMEAGTLGDANLVADVATDVAVRVDGASDAATCTPLVFTSAVACNNNAGTCASGFFDQATHGGPAPTFCLNYSYGNGVSSGLCAEIVAPCECLETFTCACLTSGIQCPQFTGYPVTHFASCQIDLVKHTAVVSCTPDGGLDANM